MRKYILVIYSLPHRDVPLNKLDYLPQRCYKYSFKIMGFLSQGYFEININNNNNNKPGKNYLSYRLSVTE